jgi:hypothetical protein
LEKELLIVRFLDWIAEESFDWIYQKKIYDNYIGVAETFLDVEKTDPTEKDRITKLKSEFDRLKVKESAYAVQEHADEVSKANGVKIPPAQQKKWVTRILFGFVIAVMAMVYLIPQLAGIKNYALFIVILPLCFLPNLMNKRIDKKSNEFKYLHREELMDEVHEEVQNIKTFIQLLIDDAQDYMVQERFPLHKLQFQLKSSDYLNIELIDEKIVQESIQYNFTFEYPEGVEPFETASSMRAGGVGVSSAISNMDLGEDNENDLFIILKNPQYKEDGTLDIDNLEYVELGYKPIAESLLENSDFEIIKDPNTVIENLEEFSTIQCTCGEPIVIGEIQKVSPRSYKDFKFYLLIGNNCEKCNANPFIFTPAPNMKIPSELADLFIDPIPLEPESPSEAVDYFTVIKNVVYNEENTLQLKDYKPVIVENVELIQEILGNGSFKKLKDPSKRFSDFNGYGIPCGCEDTSPVVDVQLVTSKKFANFKFYLLIGEKCIECNVEPFMLISAPNEEIPEELLSIF